MGKEEAIHNSMFALQDISNQGSGTSFWEAVLIHCCRRYIVSLYAVPQSSHHVIGPMVIGIIIFIVVIVVVPRGSIVVVIGRGRRLLWVWCQPLLPWRPYIFICLSFKVDVTAIYSLSAKYPKVDIISRLLLLISRFPGLGLCLADRCVRTMSVDSIPVI